MPDSDEVFLYGVCSKVPSDCLADCITRWWQSVRERFAHLSTLVINLDNGPENHSRRTQFMQRMVDFALHYCIFHAKVATDSMAKLPPIPR